MSYDAIESSTHDSRIFELFLFQTLDQEWAVTSAEKEIPFGGRTYYPVAGLYRTDVNKANENKSDDVTVTLPSDHEVAQLFSLYMPDSQLTLVVFRGHYGDNDVAVNFSGNVTNAKFTDACELTCSPDEAQLKRRIPNKQFSKACPHILFQPGCNVDRAKYRVPSTLTFVNDKVIKAAEFAAKPSGYFTAGYIEYGNARRMIADHQGDTCTLLLPLATLHLGLQVSAYPGCNQRYNGDCITKFDNGNNYEGFEWIPTRNPYKGLKY